MPLVRWNGQTCAATLLECTRIVLHPYFVSGLPSHLCTLPDNVGCRGSCSTNAIVCRSRVLALKHNACGSIVSVALSALRNVIARTSRKECCGNKSRSHV